VEKTYTIILFHAGCAKALRRRFFSGCVNRLEKKKNGCSDRRNPFLKKVSLANGLRSNFLLIGGAPPSSNKRQGGRQVKSAARGKKLKARFWRKGRSPALRIVSASKTKNRWVANKTSKSAGKKNEKVGGGARKCRGLCSGRGGQ